MSCEALANEPRAASIDKKGGPYDLAKAPNTAKSEAGLFYHLYLALRESS